MSPLEDSARLERRANRVRLGVAVEPLGGGLSALRELARKHKAPVFTASILRFEPALTRFRNRIPEIGMVGATEADTKAALRQSLAVTFTFFDRVLRP